MTTCNRPNREMVVSLIYIIVTFAIARMMTAKIVSIAEIFFICLAILTIAWLLMLVGFRRPHWVMDSLLIVMFMYHSDGHDDPILRFVLTAIFTTFLFIFDNFMRRRTEKTVVLSKGEEMGTLLKIDDEQSVGGEKGYD